MPRRTHHKVTTFPPEIVEEVNKRLVEGHTHEDIANWLKQMGHTLGRSSVQRYSQDFMSRLERLKMIKEQARAIVHESGDTPGTEMAEAASQIALELIISKLQKAQDLNDVDIADLLKAIPRYEQSAVRREALKFHFSKGVEAAATKIKEALKKELQSDHDLMQRVIDLVDKTKEQVANG